MVPVPVAEVPVPLLPSSLPVVPLVPGAVKGDPEPSVLEPPVLPLPIVGPLEDRVLPGAGVVGAPVELVMPGEPTVLEVPELPMVVEPGAEAVLPEPMAPVPEPDVHGEPETPVPVDV